MSERKPTESEVSTEAIDLGLKPGAADPWRIGQAYFIRTVTMYLAGRLAFVGAQELVLTDAAWVADTGRFREALVSGVLQEVEPMPSPVIIGRGSIIDATAWPHPLPLKLK